MAVIGISQPSSIVLQYSRLQRNYLWDVLLPDINSPLAKIPVVGKILEGVQGLAMTQYVQGVSFGDYDIEQTTMKYGAYQANFAGLLKANEVSITFLKPMPDFISSYFYAWKNLIVGSDGLYNPKNKYQKNIFT